MKVEIDKLPIFTRAALMTVGQVGIITEECMFRDAVLLRTGDGLVNLANPNQTWEGHVSFKVRLLQPGTEIKLTVEV